MAKIYSRWRIKLPNLKKPNKFRLILFVMFMILFIVIILFIYAAYPIFIINCKSNATSLGVKIVNNEVNKVMSEYTYNDLITIEKDNSGNIKLIEAKIVPINQIISKITTNIQDEINKPNKSTVRVNIGTVTGIAFLKFFSPKIDIQFETAGNVNTNLMSKFESVGINQTLHRIYLEIKSDVFILTPFNTIRRNNKDRNVINRSCNYR